jgi:anti-sigma-K factor RskA
MTSHEPSALVGAYALDALDQPEWELLETHLADCTDCAAELVSLRAATAELTHASAAGAPQAVRDEVLTAIGRIRPLPPRAGITTLRPRPTHRWRWPATAAACALIAVIAAGWGLQEHRQLAGPRVSASALSSDFDSPDVVTASMPVGGSGHATFIYSKAKGQIVLIGQDIPLLPSGRTYQLWMLGPNGTVSSAGLFRPNRNGSILVQASGDLNHTRQMGISIERSGGAAQPTPGAIISRVTV